MKPCRTSLLPVVGNLNSRLNQIHVKLYLLNLTMALKLIAAKPNSKSHQRVCLISRAHLSSFVRAEAPRHPRTLIWRPVGGIPAGWVMGWKHRDSALGDHKAEESRGGGGWGRRGHGLRNFVIKMKLRISVTKDQRSRWKEGGGPLKASCLGWRLAGRSTRVQCNALFIYLFIYFLDLLTLYF